MKRDEIQFHVSIRLNATEVEALLDADQIAALFSGIAVVLAAGRPPTTTRSEEMQNEMNEMRERAARITAAPEPGAGKGEE